MDTGAYELLCGPTKQRYIGSSGRSVSNRLSHHWATLSKGAHYNAALQDAFNKFGRSAFRTIWHPCAPDAAILIEQRKITYWLARGLCFNKHLKAESASGFKLSAAQREAMAVAAKERCTLEWRAAVSERVKKQHAEGRFAYDPATAKRHKPWKHNGPHGLKGRKQTPEHIAAVQAARRKPKEKK